MEHGKRYLQLNASNLQAASGKEHYFPELPSSRSSSPSSSSAASGTQTSSLSSHKKFRVLKTDVVEDDCYVVAALPAETEPDTIYPAPWKSTCFKFSSVLFMLNSILGFWMFYLQYWALIDSNTLPVWRLRLHWFVFFGGFRIPFLNLQDWTAFLTSISPWRPRLRLVGHNVPPVDVLVTACNEQIDIVQDTVRAALHIDYPPDRFRVIVTDDGASGKLEAWVAEMAAASTHNNIFYTARRKTGVNDYKAGNINHAIQFVNTLPGGAAEFVAVLDADMIPSPAWLRAMTAHLVRDESVGVVCPAQQFYNVPATDPLYQQWNHEWQLGHSLHDAISISANYGSGWVARRVALDSIGGMPTNCLTEDTYSAYLMLARGWRTGYVTETLQWGLVPDSYNGHIKQMTRWYIGGCQATRFMSFFLRRSVTKKMTWMMRILSAFGSLQIHVLQPYFGIVGLMVSPIALAAGLPVFVFKDSDARLALRLSAASEVISWVIVCMRSIFTGYGPSVRVANTISICLVPYFAIAHFRTFILPERWGGRSDGFTPTGTIRSAIQERCRFRAPVLQRLRHVLFDGGAWMQALLLFLYLGALLLCLHREFSVGASAGYTAWRILRSAGWPGMMWLRVVIGALQPLVYVLRPPTMPDRAELMGKRSYPQGPRYPTERAKNGGSRQKGSFWAEMILFHWYSLYVVYCVILFVGTWYW